MAYSPNNWVDRVISGALRYDIKDNSGSPLYTQIQILLHNTVSVAGSLLTAAWMNHLEGGLQTADANASSALTSISNNQSDGLALNTSGTSTAFTITTTGAIALTTGEHWRILFNATAGATPTLNRDGKGAKSLKYYNSSGSKVACGPTTIYSGMVAEIIVAGVVGVAPNHTPQRAVVSVDITPPGTLPRTFGVDGRASHRSGCGGKPAGIGTRATGREWQRNGGGKQDQAECHGGAGGGTLTNTLNSVNARWVDGLGPGHLVQSIRPDPTIENPHPRTHFTNILHHPVRLGAMELATNSKTSPVQVPNYTDRGN